MSPTMLLLVDDSPTILQLRTARLQRLGFAVSTATNALSALAVLERTPVAAVLLEYNLEGMDAEAVAFHIKQSFPTAPVILLSAFDDLPERVLWLVDDYVMKSEPLERVAAVVKKSRTSGREDAGNIGNIAAPASSSGVTPFDVVADVSTVCDSGKSHCQVTSITGLFIDLG